MERIGPQRRRHACCSGSAELKQHRRIEPDVDRAPWENVMSNMSERVAGAAKELGGKIKGAVGEALGNEQMQAEGKAQELAGAAKQALAKAAERGKAAVEGALGAIKEHVGAGIGNEQMQVEGIAKGVVADVRKKINQ
jgi:uncharacterized protein YjbJ (UPF0337 family)